MKIKSIKQADETVDAPPMHILGPYIECIYTQTRGFLVRSPCSVYRRTLFTYTFNQLITTRRTRFIGQRYTLRLIRVLVLLLPTVQYSSVYYNRREGGNMDGAALCA